MEKEIIDNHTRYLERITLYKTYGYDVEKERDFIVEQARPLCGKILEAGTGKGYFAIALAKNGIHFVTFDISPEEQQIAKFNVAYFGFEKFIDFKVENAEHTSFPDKSFDMIFLVNLIHHLQNPYQVIDELIRILRANGKMVIADFTEEGFNLLDKIHALDGRVHEKGNVTLSEIKLFLAKKGFSITQKQSVIQDVLIATKVVI